MQYTRRRPVGSGELRVFLQKHPLLNEGLEDKMEKNRVVVDAMSAEIGLDKLAAQERDVARPPYHHDTTVNRDVLSKSALERIRNSLRTSGSISCASSSNSTGLMRAVATWDFHRSRSALNPPQRLDGLSFTEKISPSSR